MHQTATTKSFKLDTFGQPLRETTGHLPEPAGSEVLLRVGSCGVCHSDLHLYDGFFDLGGGHRADLSKGVNPPRTLGHEIAGEVVALGPLAQDISIGERRVVYPWIGCGQCGPCLAGSEQLCNRPQALGVNADGGFSDHVLVPHPRYLIDFGTIPEHLACTLACSGLTAFSALKKVAPLAFSDPLLIIGAGGVGLAGVRLCQPVLGVAPVVAEIDTGKWPAAKDAGARAVIDPSQSDARKKLLADSGGFAAVIDFVGSQATAEFGLAVLRKGGRLITVGLFGGAITIALPTLPLRAISLGGSYVGSLDEMKQLVLLVRQGVHLTLPVTTRALSLAQQSLDDLRAGRVVGRVVLQP